MWKVVRSSYDVKEDLVGCRLQKGDIIKIGRVWFRIKDLMAPGYKKLEVKQKDQ